MKRKRAVATSSARADEPRPTGRPRLFRPLKRARPNGRPRSSLPSELMDRLGMPPADPLAKSGWWAQMIELLMWGVLKGEPWSELLDKARTSAAVASKLIPEAIRFQALNLLREDKEDRASQDAPDDEPIAKEPANAARTTPLRRDPSRS